jgi:hypothetical protein
MQHWDLFNAPSQAGYPTNEYQIWTIPGDYNQAFAYWDDPIYDADGAPDSTFPVGDRVIGYFEYSLKQTPTSMHFQARAHRKGDINELCRR